MNILNDEFMTSELTEVADAMGALVAASMICNGTDAARQTFRDEALKMAGLLVKFEVTEANQEKALSLVIQHAADVCETQVSTWITEARAGRPETIN